MKHNLSITVHLIGLFFFSQLIGLLLLNQSIEQIEYGEDGTIEVVYEEPYTGRPDLQGQDSFTYTLIMILFGTALLLLLIKFRLFNLWKLWFFLAVMGALSISFAVFIPETYAIALGIIFAYLKLFKPNVIIHNLTEVFMYSGIAILIAPLFTVFWMIMMLIAISIYDAIAVWKSKHMITLAKAQADNKMFAGILIPYTTSSNKKTIIHHKIPKGFKKQESKSAILGGGDMAFSLLFAGSVMTELIQSGLTKEIALLKSLVVSLFAGIALLLLLFKSHKDKFYPAMPFITTGCLIGYALIILS